MYMHHQVKSETVWVWDNSLGFQLLLQYYPQLLTL